MRYHHTSLRSCLCHSSHPLNATMTISGSMFLLPIFIQRSWHGYFTIIATLNHIKFVECNSSCLHWTHSLFITGSFTANTYCNFTSWCFPLQSLKTNTPSWQNMGKQCISRYIITITKNKWDEGEMYIISPE